MNALPKQPDKPAECSIRYSLTLTALAALTLLAGLIFYVVMRPAGSVALLPATAHIDINPAVARYGVALQSLPSLLHVYAFCLLSAAVIGPSSRAGWMLAAFWAALESLFELSQNIRLQELIAPVIGRQTSLSMRNATFDSTDLVAIAAGALAAGLTLHLFHLHYAREPASC